MMDDLGFKIKKLREQRNISQEQLATELDISQSKLSKIENGRITKIDFALMTKLSDLFEISLEDFLERERERERLKRKQIQN